MSENYVLYRRLPDYGWYVVGYAPAKTMGMRHYALENPTCARGHVAPMSVEKVRCVKCLIVENRNKQGKTHLTKEEAKEFWRRKLKLPREANVPENPRFVYVVENVPYTTMQQAAMLTGLSKGMIMARCKHESKYVDYHQLATRYHQWEDSASIID